MFTRNVGNMDRTARVVLGLALLAAFFATAGEPLRWLALLGAVLALATGILGSCGVYAMLGMSTCKAK